MPDFTPDQSPDEFSPDVIQANNIQNPNVIRWQENPGPVEGFTPFGIYDADPVFRAEAPRAAIWAGRRLGYPIMDIEMRDINFYACLEEAVSDYSSQVNQFNIINNISLLQGLPTNTDVTQQNVQGIGLNLQITLAKAYGTETGTGGNVDWKHAYFQAEPGVGVYDLQALIGDVVEGGNRIEIKRVFHKELPASRIFAPFASTGLMGGGMGQPTDLLNELGGGPSGGWQFFMTPVFEDLLRWQAVEFNQQMRRSLFSFEIVNNKIRVFPMPHCRFKIWIDYIVEKDRAAQVIFDSNGNVPPNTSNGCPPTQSNDPTDPWYCPETQSYSVGRIGDANPNSPNFNTMNQYSNLTPQEYDNIITLDGGLDPIAIEGPRTHYRSSNGDPAWPGDAAPGWKPTYTPPPTPPTASPAPNASPVIGDYSNVPYMFIKYANINDVGKQWIRKYFLALCKEVLGTIRSKYATLPIPGSETTLDGSELRAEATAEKTELIQQLRDNLLATGRTAQMASQADQAQQLEDSLKKVPLFIYVGMWFLLFCPLFY
jgi:hypothetical protein